MRLTCHLISPNCKLMGGYYEKIYISFGKCIYCADTCYVWRIGAKELPTSFMYEDGNYVEVTYVNRNYEITDNMFAPSKSMLDDVSSLHFATKFDAGENLSVGLARYNQAGASHNYQVADHQFQGLVLLVQELTYRLALLP